MKIKEKIIGIAIILLGVLPFLLKIEKIGTIFTANKFISYLSPGGIIYQGIIIILGIVLILSVRTGLDY